MFLARSKQAEEQRERILTFKRVFSSPEGKTVLTELMNRFHVLNTHKGDPFKEGERSAVLWILSQAKINVEELDKLLEGKD